jgi:hypothetical protein
VQSGKDCEGRAANEAELVITRMGILRATALALVALVILSAALFAAYFSSLTLEETVYANDRAQFNLLIASDATDFKDGLLQRILSSYRAHARIQLINIRSLAGTDTDSTDAILILDTCVACNDMASTISSYLETTEVRDRLVLVMTFGDSRDRFSHAGVDAISAASRASSLDDLYLKTTAQIDHIVAQRSWH